MNIDIVPQRSGTAARNGRSCFAGIFGAAVLCAGLFAAPAAVLADGGLETQKEGLFHRKGWIDPSIYRRDPSSEVRKYPSGGRSSLGGPVSRKKSTPRKRSVAAADGEGPSSRARSKRRIPSRIVRNSERSVAGLRSKPARKPVRVASLGRALELPRQSHSKSTGSVTGGSGRVQWVASSGCVPGSLRAAINHVARNFGAVRVNSTCRSRRRNARVGGAGGSYHLKGQAADIRVFGNIGSAARYLRSVVGGFRHYGGGLFHIDTGPRRSW